MEANEAPLYFVWGIDHVAYGPVELPTLVNWIRDERVEKDTWIYDQRGRAWLQALELAELKAVFSRRSTAYAAPGNTTAVIKPGSLRRIKALAELADEQLQSFARYLDLVRLPQHTTVVKAGDEGDAMFMLLEGELRVRVLVRGKESILATLEPGESFGELALLDEGKRSADVIANVDSMVLKITRAGLKKLFDEAPALAAPFLHALGRATAARLRATNRRVEDSIRLSNSVQGAEG
ncbi:MAG: cyclic nucleotide-binding domain-containing protein [Verrucomicrobia bacterium]|jgi:CRP-like cAMP-binding protein|nr:cyclic nucleotide-binding domain-containing protein [Verrucomicrobiota bacterium]